MHNFGRPDFSLVLVAACEADDGGVKMTADELAAREREADDGGGKMTADELAAEREEIMRDHDEVEERHQAEFWGE